MLPTPSLSHLSKDHYRRVYEPAEDTFLLIDALESDLQEIKSRNPTLALEIGYSSGALLKGPTRPYVFS